MNDVERDLVKQSVDLIDDVINRNESVFAELDLDKCQDENNSVVIIFQMLWQIGVRWKSIKNLVATKDNIAIKIILRSVFEIQKNLEYILLDPKQTRNKLLAYNLNLTIENLKAIESEVPKDIIEKISLESFITKMKLEEISDLVFFKFKKNEWRKFNWRLLFANDKTFSVMTDHIDEDFATVTRSLFKQMSLDTHGNGGKVSEVITKENPFNEEIEKTTLALLLILLCDFEAIVEDFLGMFYPANLEKWQSDGRVRPYIQMIVPMLFLNELSIENIESKIQEIKFGQSIH